MPTPVTISSLVDEAHEAATTQGMSLSRENVAFIISHFLQGLSTAEYTPSLDAWLQSLAAEVNNPPL